LKDRKTRELQIHVIVIIYIVNADHIMSVFKETLTEMKTYKASGAGDKVIKRIRSFHYYAFLLVNSERCNVNGKNIV